MSSYEDRIRAVELFIELGKRVRPTIRQLGYPTKNSLKGWFRGYEQPLDLPMGYAGGEVLMFLSAWPARAAPASPAPGRRPGWSCGPS